jgi:hypothetical protein
MTGIAERPEAIRAILGFARTLYEYQEFNFVGPYGDRRFVEDYTSVVRGEPIGSVVVVRLTRLAKPPGSSSTTSRSARCCSGPSSWASTSPALVTRSTSSATARRRRWRWRHDEPQPSTRRRLLLRPGELARQRHQWHRLRVPRYQPWNDESLHGGWPEPEFAPRPRRAAVVRVSHAAKQGRREQMWLATELIELHRKEAQWPPQ